MSTSENRNAAAAEKVCGPVTACCGVQAEHVQNERLDGWRCPCGTWVLPGGSVFWSEQDQRALAEYIGEVGVAGWLRGLSACAQAEYKAFDAMFGAH